MSYWGGYGGWAPRKTACSNIITSMRCVWLGIPVLLSPEHS